MSSVPKQRMTVDEFLVWAEGRPGRYELEAGEVVQRSPQRMDFARTKMNCCISLKEAVTRAGVSCHVLPDGFTVRISDIDAYEPSALAYIGEKLPGDAIDMQHPIIVVEILSPTTTRIDKMGKLLGYFSLPSVHHYLIVHPEKRLLIHHARGQGDLIETRILSSGPLRLDPPGLALTVEEFFREE